MMREKGEFHHMWEEFHHHETLVAQLTSSQSRYPCNETVHWDWPKGMKLCTETGLRASPMVWAIVWVSTSSKLMNLNEKRVQLVLNIVQWENSVLGIERAYLFSPS
jgi:hypothetical protein